MTTRRCAAALAIVMACTAAVSGTAMAGDSDSGSGRTRRDPALVRISGLGAQQVAPDDDGSRRLVISGVSRDATFDARRTPAFDMSTYGAVALLNTAPAPALLKGTTDDETEGLVLSNITYDESTETLEADVTGVDGVTDLPVMEEVGEEVGDAVDSDGELPEGPVELIVADTDTQVASSGEPQPPRSGASSSYSVPIKIQYNTISYKGQPVSAKISGEFLANKSHCTSGTNFAERASTRSPIETSFSVDTTIGCFFDVSEIVYKIGLTGTAGPLRLPGSESELTITSVAPRTFVSGCPDTGAAEIECGVRDIVVAPRVFVNIRTK